MTIFEQRLLMCLEISELWCESFVVYDMRSSIEQFARSKSDGATMQFFYMRLNTFRDSLNTLGHGFGVARDGVCLVIIQHVDQLWLEF